MDRTEAVTYLKSLLFVCSDMSPEAVSVENEVSSDSSGYRVHIKGTIHEIEKQKVIEIAKKYGLQVKETQFEVIVYKSR